MNRINTIRNYVDEIFDRISDGGKKRAAYIHTYGVTQNIVLLAKKRGLDAEIAAAAGLLHDIYSYKTSVGALHSHNGAEMIRVAFKYELSGLFTEPEQILIKSAVYHHSDKTHKHDEYDELLKDADILQHYLSKMNSGGCYYKRLERVCAQLGFAVEKVDEIIGINEKSAFCQTKAADIAEKLAAKNIAGIADDADFLEIIKYYPEKSAFSELENAWCAAFVYHCFIEAGLALPLRTPNVAKQTANCRFACVAGWYEWAKRLRFLRFEKDGYTPVRGDIVVYSGIIPAGDKPANGARYDHIGIVLQSGVGLTVAEGNVGNRNISGIVERERDETIGCYIHIPADYIYEDWKIDFKTGEIRVIDD